MTSWMSNFKFFIVYHKNLNQKKIFPKYAPDYVKRFFKPYAVNSLYPKTITYKSDAIEYQDHGIFEYELEKYNPFLQKRGYMETSAYLHVAWNNLDKDYDYIGFTQYDMVHHQECRGLRKDTIYILTNKESIVLNGQWNKLMFPELRNLNYLLSHYNKHFGKGIVS